MSVPKHIVFLCSRLDLPGGIERAVINTANLFDQHGHKVQVLVLDVTAETFYPVNPTVEISQHPLSFGITREGNIISRKIKMLSDVLQLRKILKEFRPDVLIATEYPFAASAVLTGTRKKISMLAWEHHHFNELKRNLFWNRIFSYAYPKLHGIIALNRDEKKYYDPINSFVTVIPNFIQPSPSVSTLQTKQILTIARLTSVKGMDRLVRIAAIVFKKHPGWKWKVIGTGDLEYKIKKEIELAALASHIELVSPLDHKVMKEYVQASLYVMLSRNECFPMTLLEAQSAGLPCISFDCETGPRHIIENEENGLLIEPGNETDMANAIIKLIEQDELRKTFGARALESAARFSPENIYLNWDAVLNKS